MGIITRGIRNAFRNVVRTISIVVILGLSIGLSLAMLVAYQAVSAKINTVKGNVGNTVTISPAGARGFEGGGNPLTQANLDTVAKLAHVTSVNGIVTDRLTTSDTSLQSAVEAGSLGRRNSQNSGVGGPPADSANTTRTFTPPVTVLGTNQPTNLSSSQGGGTFKLTSGEVFSSGSTENVAVVGSSLATKNNLAVGSTFTAYNGTTIKVIGIFDAGNTFSNNQVIMPLATVQKLSSQVGEYTSATAYVDSIGNVDSVTKAASSALGTAADVTNAAAQAQAVVTPLENIQSISLYSLIGAVVAGSIIILLTMIMIVRERRREIGVLKAIGASNIRVVLQFAVEAVTLTLMAAVIGIGLGFAVANPITNMLVTSSTTSNASGGQGDGFGRGFGQLRGALTNIQGVVDWHIVLYGLGVAVLIAVIGSVLASFFITKIRPAEVMRAE